MSKFIVAINKNKNTKAINTENWSAQQWENHFADLSDDRKFIYCGKINSEKEALEYATSMSFIFR